jgi:ribosomal protein L20
MARVKGAMMSRKKKKQSLETCKGLLGRKVHTL